MGGSPGRSIALNAAQQVHSLGVLSLLVVEEGHHKQGQLEKEVEDNCESRLQTEPLQSWHLSPCADEECEYLADGGCGDGRTHFPEGIHHPLLQMGVLLLLERILDDEHVVDPDGQDEKGNDLHADHGVADIQVGEHAHGAQERGDHDEDACEGEGEPRGNQGGELTNGHSDVDEHGPVADDHYPRVLCSLLHQLIRYRPLGQVLKVAAQLRRRKVLQVERKATFEGDISLGTHIEVPAVLGREGAIIGIEPVDGVDEHVLLPRQRTFPRELVLIEHVSPRQGFGIDPAVVAGDRDSGRVVHALVAGDAPEDAFLQNGDGILIGAGDFAGLAPGFDAHSSVLDEGVFVQICDVHFPQVQWGCIPIHLLGL